MTPTKENDMTSSRTRGTAQTNLAPKPKPDITQFARCIAAQRDLDRLFEDNLTGLLASDVFDADGEPTEPVVTRIMRLVEDHPNADDLKMLMVATGLGEAAARLLGEARS
jgi:hypothetical protein